MDAFQREQQALGQEMQLLFAQGATEEQVQAWQKRNEARFAAQQQRAKDLAGTAPLQPLPIIEEVEVPGDATPELADFLSGRAYLQNRFAELHNRKLQSAQASGRRAVAADAEDVAPAFENQNRAQLEALSRLAKKISDQAARQPQPMPLALEVPANTPPRLREFLTARDALMREQIALGNQSADPAAREAALEQWSHQNALRIERMQELAKALSAKTKE